MFSSLSDFLRHHKNTYLTEYRHNIHHTNRHNNHSTSLTIHVAANSHNVHINQLNYVFKCAQADLRLQAHQNGVQHRDGFWFFDLLLKASRSSKASSMAAETAPLFYLRKHTHTHMQYAHQLIAHKG